MQTPPPADQQKPPAQIQPAVAQKAYQFAFAGEGKAELRITGEYTAEDIDDLDSLLKTTLNGLRRSLKVTKEPVQ
jgi:hypothetical protein